LTFNSIVAGGIHAVLFGVSVATSLINLGLDIILKVKGCCFFYRSICRNTKEYNRRSKALGRQIKSINREWKIGRSA
jgi:Flp pilus assembly protein TadB